MWLETSRILVANILRVLSAEGRTTLPDLLDALQVKGKEEMKVWLAFMMRSPCCRMRESESSHAAPARCYIEISHKFGVRLCSTGKASGPTSASCF